jgi:phage-related minor tail protein
MISLDAIQFSADTSELDTAAKKIESLGTAISALSLDLSKLDKASLNAAKSQKTIAKAAEDAAEAEQQLSKAKTSTVSSTDAATRAVEKQTLAMKIFRGEAIDLNDQVLTLGSSFTKGQSGQLANLKLLGATNEQLKTLSGSFEDFNKITSSNTFDNSAAGLGKLSKEIFELKKVNDLMQRGVALTRDEIVNLVRDSERLTQQFKSEGLSAQQTIQALGGLEAQTIKLAKEKNELIARTRASEIAAKSEANALEKSAQDAAKASGFLSREMERVDNVLTGFNSNLNVTSSNRLMKFREQLKLSGVDAVTAAGMLKTYEDRLKTINSTNQNISKNKREDELKYLARATSVQLGDIGISLAGGQNPLLVLIQQGDQLRGVLNQVGASGNEMQKALSMAFSQIVVGSKDVVMALGSFVVGAFVDTGKAAINAVNNFTGLGNALEIIRYKLTLARNEGVAYSGAMLKAFEVLGTAVTAFAAVSIAGLIIGLAGLAIGYYKVIKENDELAKSLALTGGALSISQTTALSYVKTLGDMGVTTGDATTAIIEMSKAGNITSDSILMIGKAAADMEKWAKVPIADTVKQFSELEKKPVDALIAIAKATGLVSPEVLRLVTEFDRQGKSSEAAAIAMKEYANVTEQQIASMKSNYSEFSIFIIKAGDAISQFFSKAFKAVAIAANPLDAAADQMKKLDEKISETKANMSSVDKLGLSFFKSDDSLLKNLEAERLSLSKFIKLQQEKNDAEEISKETNVQNAKAQEYINSLREKNMSSEIKAQNELTELLQKKKKLLAEGNLSNAADLKIMDEAIKKQEKIIADANKPKKEKTPKLTEGQKGLESYIDILNKAKGLTNSYNNDLNRLQAARKEGVITEQEYVAAVEELILQQPFYIKGQKEIADNEKELAKLIKEKLKVEEDLGKAKDSNSTFLNREQSIIDKSIESSRMKLELLGKTEDQQFEITEQYRLQNQLAEIGLRYDERRTKLKQDFTKLYSLPSADIGKLEKEYEDALAGVNDQQLKAVDSAMQGSANTFEVRYTEKILNVGKVLSDAITTALFEGGQAGTKKLKDYIVGIFRDKINVTINAVVNSGINSLLGIGGNNSSGASGTPGGSGGVGISSIGSLFTDFSGSVASGITNMGSMLMDTGSEMLGDFGASLISNSSAIGNAASSIGAGLSYLSAAIDASKGQWGKAIGTAVGQYFLGPIGGAIGSALGGWVDKAFGGGEEYTVAKGFRLRANSEGFKSAGFQQWRNDGSLGSASSTGINYSETDSAMSSQMSKMYAGIQAQTAAFATSLGLSTDKIKDYTHEIWVNVEGLSAEDAKKKLAEAFTELANGMADIFSSDISGLAKEGEKSSDTLARLAVNLSVVNSSLDILGGSLIPIGIEGAKVASSMVDAFGGIEKMNSAVSTYYDIMYSDAEKAQRATDGLSKQFAKLGMEVPKSEAGFRNLVNGIDSTTSSGQRLIASLMELAPAFDQVSQNAQQAAADMLNALQNYGTPQEVRQFEIGNVVGALANAGLTLTQDQITNATVASVRELYMQLNANAGTQGQAAALMQQQAAIFALITARDNGTSGYGENGLMPGSSSGSVGGGGSVGEQAAVIDKAIQATLDYNQAMLEATGTTAEIAAAQRALADAAKLAAGWTQTQIDTLNRALDLKINLGNLEQARQSVMGLFRQIEENARNTQAAVNSAKQNITTGYLNAVQRQAQAQEAVNSLIREAAEEMRGFANGIRDFLTEVGSSDLGTNSKLQQLAVLQSEFDKTILLAKGGDRKAFGSATDKARSLMTAGKDQFSTAEDFARFSASIGNSLTDLATIADAQAGPIATAIDPMIAAQQELALATFDLVKWSEAASISGAETSLATTDYLAEWRIAEAANVIAQQELREAQLLTKDVNMELLSVLDQLVAAMSVFNAANAITPVYGGEVPLNETGVISPGMGSDVRTIQDLYSVNLGRQGDQEGLAYWANKFLADGIIDAAERQEFAIAALPEYQANQANRPSFDVGINEVPYDMTADVHAGERILPAADNRELMQRLSSPVTQSDNSELVAEVKMLRERLIMIESNTASTAVHSAKTARLLDRVMPDGDAIATREAAAL